MSLIQATIRNTETKGQVNSLRKEGKVPGIIYGGENTNQKIFETILRQKCPTQKIACFPLYTKIPQIKKTVVLLIYVTNILYIDKFIFLICGILG